MILAVALLLAATTAFGARVQTAGLDTDSYEPGSYTLRAQSEPDKQKMLKGLGCYCKKVASMDDCPDYKEGKKATQPEHSRWFHSNAANSEKMPHFCCKLDSSSWFNHVGFKYKRQASFTLCTYENRKVPQEACCRVGKVGERVGLRVKNVEMLLSKEILNWNNDDNEFLKSYPILLSSDITGGTDYDGSSVSAEDARKFLENRIKGGLMAGMTPFCAAPFHKMIKDTGDCRLRKEPPTECCCLQESIVKAEGCLELPESSAKTPPQILVVNGSYSEHREHGYRQGKITWPSRSSEMDQDLSRLKSKNPNATSQSMEFDWAPGNQWTSRCLDIWSVKKVKSTRKSRRVSNGYKTVGMGKFKRRKRKWKTTYRTVYSQDSSKQCISKEYARKCPKGHAYFVKEFPLGTCTKTPGSSTDELQLNDLGGLTYECPEGYKSGKDGAVKFDPACKCQGGCL